ncbi:MAG: flagellar basal body L-ring protein FlgH [Limnochordia bacterium]|nr:flagellar basal body L-ring protein FlgH [Limnochordia bacterium]MDI9464430.1 flagellar basal body L-ring protein FlgH [Bacillota bacterium]NLO95031.1 flagellar basal body L-ring protein FlgH [Bacillota bacterium]HAN95817.1 flagellar biosynthesis protein FlgH [Bacillota bacterium]HOB39688.1 flagellar basal body L-ring protein FlgH [Limnochordia bacterium]
MKRPWYLTITLLSAVGLLLGSTTLTVAESLFPVDQPASMFADRKARRPGDLVTVIIVEQAQARQTATTSTGKDSEVSVGPGGGVLADLIPLLRLGGGDSFSADGAVTRGGSLTAKITTKVVETYANNTLRIEGRQKIVVNGEEQEIVLTGLVRGEDIAPDNTVLSTFVADAEISFVGTGIVGEKNKPGLLTRLFNWLF